MAGRRQVRRGRQVLDVDEVLLQPLRVGLRAREIALDLLVRHDAPLHGIDQEDAARVQPLLDQDVLRRDVEDADLRRHDHEVVLRHVVARRPQAVAIEHGADDRPVGEGDRRRAVPRLHQRRVVFVERPQLRAHALVAGPRLGDRHQDRVRQRPPRHHQELEHVVERGGVAAAFADDRQDLLEVLAEQRRFEQPFAGAHPVDVAAQRVDLAVVRDVAVRVRERPRREGVGAEALMHERERRRHIRVQQIREHRLDLAGRQHALVDQGVGREADDVEELLRGVGERQPVGFVLDPLADHVQLALEAGPRAGARQRGVLRDEHVLEDRLDGHRARADRGVVGRHVPPSEHGLPFLGHDPRDQRLGGLAIPAVPRQEHQADAVLARRRQRRRRHLAQERVGHLNQDPRAVAGVDLAAARAAVLQVLEDLERLPKDARAICAP